jgi:hypothetical protein
MIDLRTQRLGQLRSATSAILDSQRPNHSLRQEVAKMMTILTDSGAIHTIREEDILGGETRTLNGLALSPTMAATCGDDFVRTIEFIRGTHAAIWDIRKQHSDRPARVLYAGCGPCATLAVPLMSIFSPKEATFILLDVHPESIASVKSMVETLGLADSIASFVTVDAGSYRVDSDRPPDVILVEMMQACLESEPQVAITRHLQSEAPNAILIPEEVRVDLMLVDPSREFDLAGQERNGGKISRDRIRVGSVLVVNRETVNSWKSNCSNRLAGSAARIPDSMEERYQPMLFTRLRVYQDHILKDCDSGLTFPRVLSVEGTIRPGDTIEFHYELGREPRLKGEIAGELTQGGLTTHSTVAAVAQ